MVSCEREIGEAQSLEFKTRRLKDFQIHILNLPNGVHHRTFVVTQAFLAENNCCLTLDREGSVSVKIDKKDSFIRVDFGITIDVVSTCDRSLRGYVNTLSIEDYLVFKYGNHDEELDDKVVMIQTNTQILDLSTYIFEFIVLSLPMKNIHPDLRGMMDEEIKDDLVYTTDKEKDKEKITEVSEPIDPRFDMLKQLKIKENGTS